MKSFRPHALLLAASLVVTNAWADPYAPDRSQNKVQVILREADLNRIATEITSRRLLGVTQTPIVFNWNEMVSMALVKLYQEKNNTSCQTKATSLWSNLYNPLGIFSSLISSFTNDCVKNLAYSVAANDLVKLYLPVSPSVPVPVSVYVKSLNFNFQTGDKVTVTAVIGMLINTEVASLTLTMDANPGFADPNAFLMFDKTDNNNLGLKVCMRGLALKLTSFNLNYANAYMKKAATDLINTQLDQVRAQIGTQYCTEVIKELTPPPHFFGKGISSFKPKIIVNDNELILQVESRDHAAVLPAIYLLLGQ